MQSDRQRNINTINAAVIILAAALLPVRAQNAGDSAAFGTALRNTREVLPGIESGAAALSLFGKPQFISFLKIDTSKYRMDIRQSPVLRVRTTRFARTAKADAAINGGFFNVRTGRPASLLKDKGKIRGNPRRYIGFSCFVASDASGNIVISPDAGSVADKDPSSPDFPYPEILTLYNPIVKDGKPVASGDPGIHPRSAIGSDGKRLVLMVADGRHPDNAAGVTLDQAGWIMSMLGCEVALNLDGGGSSTLWNRTEGITNHPSDNKRFDRKGERAVGNALLFVPRRPE